MCINNILSQNFVNKLEILNKTLFIWNRGNIWYIIFITIFRESSEGGENLEMVISFSCPQNPTNYILRNEMKIERKRREEGRSEEKAGNKRDRILTNFYVTVLRRSFVNVKISYLGSVFLSLQKIKNKYK